MSNDKVVNYNLNDKELYIDCQLNTNDIGCDKLSWISIVDEEKGDNIIEHKVLSGSLRESDSSVTCKNIANNTNIDTILLLIPTNLDDIDILKNQIVLLEDIKNNYKTINNFTELIPKLEWLMNGAKCLSDKIGLLNIDHGEIVDNTIYRSSYKFCNYNYECEYNYNVKKHVGCYAHHYVHNIVYADVKAIIDYINKYSSNSQLYDKETMSIEIIKSLVTILFVIRHMFDELSNSIEYRKNNNVHLTRLSSKKSNRKIRRNTKKVICDC